MKLKNYFLEQSLLHHYSAVFRSMIPFKWLKGINPNNIGCIIPGYYKPQKITLEWRFLLNGDWVFLLCPSNVFTGSEKLILVLMEYFETM